MIINIILQLMLWANTSSQHLSENFVTPPAELSSHVIWGWEGMVDHATICHDLDSMKVKGFRSVIIEAGYGLPFEYLSEEWFQHVRYAVEQAESRGMKVWAIDEGKYPSGFAGGKFTRERPDMRMKALVVKDTIMVVKGDVLKGVGVPNGVIAAVAVSTEEHLDRNIPINEGKIDFIAGDSDWKVLLVGPDFRTGQTRAVNNPTRGKDTKNSQCDYLDPAAVRQFIDWTHEQYKQHIGDKFGTTFLGFRGDEPDFSYLPWTDSMTVFFQEAKGYDPTPYLGCLLGANPDRDAKRFRADYWDVWSSRFASSFFGQQAEWCEENGVSYITHLNKDHDISECTRVEGDLFRDLSKVQIPGVDAIWNQIWPGTDNDFPKYASSVSHVYGRQRSFSESFAAYNIPPDIKTAEYAVNYQIARGINFFEFMFWVAGSKFKTWMTDPGMKGLNDYTARATYLMSQGRPGAQIAVYLPSSAFWLLDSYANNDLTELSRMLMSHQKDFDWVGDDAIIDALEICGGGFINKSGQKYKTLIIPSCSAISSKAWEKISEFAKRGGKVLFWGRRPSILYDKTFTETESIPYLKHNCFEEPSISWSRTVEAALPSPEFKLIENCPSISYTSRQLQDGIMYFIMNESNEPCTISAELDYCGTVKEWNCKDGSINKVECLQDYAGTEIKLDIAPWEGRFISVTRSDKEYNVRKSGVRGNGKVETASIQAAIDFVFSNGGGTVRFPAGTYLSGALFFPPGVNLKLDKGAVLRGTSNPEDYPMVTTRFEGIERQWRCAFLNFSRSDGAVVSGGGIIDGNGLEWKKVSPEGGKPRLICFSECSGGTVKNIKLRNQACWGLHILYSDDFKVTDTDIAVTEYIPSSDGIDIDSSTRVEVRNCYISVHDDCISIKSGKDSDGRRVGRPSEDIIIENCHFGYGHGAVAIGSEISGDIRNVTVRKCHVDEGNWAPIRFKSQPSRGGLVENICFEDITMKDVNNVFDVILDWRSRSQRNIDIPYSDPVTRLKDITIRNVRGTAKSMGQFVGYGISPISEGTFVFEDCSFATQTGLTIKNANIDTKGIQINYNGQ